MKTNSVISLFKFYLNVYQASDTVKSQDSEKKAVDQFRDKPSQVVSTEEFLAALRTLSGGLYREKMEVITVISNYFNEQRFSGLSGRANIRAYSNLAYALLKAIGERADLSDKGNINDVLETIKRHSDALAKDQETADNAMEILVEKTEGELFFHLIQQTTNRLGGNNEASIEKRFSK